MIADLDTLVTALYVELTDQIIPFAGQAAAASPPSAAPTSSPALKPSPKKTDHPESP